MSEVRQVTMANEGYFCMVHHGVLDLGLSAGAVALYVVFLKYADKATGEAFPSRKTLAKLLRVSAPTVDKHIGELEGVGLVESYARWMDTEGRLSTSRTGEFNTQTSNGYVVQGYEGVSNILTPRVKNLDPPGENILTPRVKNLYTNYNHSNYNHLELEGGAPNATTSRGTRIRQDWTPKPETVEKVRASSPGLDLEAEHEKFIDYFLSVSGSKGVKRDWDAAWRNWMRRAREWSPNSATARNSKSDFFKNMAEQKAKSLIGNGSLELEGF